MEPLHDPKPFWGATPEPTPDPSAPKRRPPRKKTEDPAAALPTPPLDPGSPLKSAVASCPAAEAAQVEGQASSHKSQLPDREKSYTEHDDEPFACTSHYNYNHDYGNDDSDDDDEEDENDDLSAAGFPSQAAQSPEPPSPFIDCYPSEDADDESGGAQLPEGYLGMSSKHTEIGRAHV